MSDRTFQLDWQEHVIVHLPSMKLGHNDIYCGKAKWRVRGLQGSCEIEVTRESLGRFFDDVHSSHEQLRGGFGFESVYGSFRLAGEITHTGHVRVTLTARDGYFSGIENPSWECEAVFGCYAEDLQKVLGRRSLFPI